MAIASIQAFNESGTCSFCRREGKDGVVCDFIDGSFSGFLCKADFWRFLRLHADQPVDAPSVGQAAPGLPRRDDGLAGGRPGLGGTDSVRQPLPVP